MVRTAVLATFNETRKGLLITWSYRFNLVAELFTLFFVFVGIMFMLGDGKLDPIRMAPTMLGYLIWYYSSIAVGNMSFGLTEEAQTGTLEQMYMSPAPTGLMVLGRSFATLVWASVQIALLAVVLILLLNIRIPMRIEGFVPLGLT